LLELDVKIHGIFLYEFFSSILLGFCRWKNREYSLHCFPVCFWEGKQKDMEKKETVSLWTVRSLIYSLVVFNKLTLIKGWHLTIPFACILSLWEE
jgi:hypothetical protein